MGKLVPVPKDSDKRWIQGILSFPQRTKREGGKATAPLGGKESGLTSALCEAGAQRLTAKALEKPQNKLRL